MRETGPAEARQAAASGEEGGLAQCEADALMSFEKGSDMRRCTSWGPVMTAVKTHHQSEMLVAIQGSCA